jgi:hypothetical protein
MKFSLHEFRNSLLYDELVSKVKEYPFIYTKAKGITRLFFSSPRIPKYKIEELIVKINTINSLTLVILPPIKGNDWMGIYVSTKQFFDETCFFKLGHDFSDTLLEEISEVICNKFEKVVFSGLSLSYLKLVSELKMTNPAIEIDIMYHGSFTQLANSYDNMVFQNLLEKLENCEVDKVGCFKKDVALYLIDLGYKGKVLQNKVVVPTDIQPKKIQNEGAIHIGLMSNHGWIKNIYNQYIAATLVKNSVIHVQTKHDLLINENVKVVSHGHMDHDSFLFFLDLLDIYLHVSFSEASPVTPLETYARGIPCLVQTSTGFFEEGSILADYLYVDALDDSQHIKEKIEEVLKNYEDISKACMVFVTKRNLQADKLFIDFLDG